MKEEKEQLQDQLLRKIAEFDNYKKRTDRDFFERVQNANEKLITELLPSHLRNDLYHRDLRQTQVYASLYCNKR